MKTILLVDDAPEIQLAVQVALGSGFLCICCTDTKSALENLQQRRFDLAIIDIVLDEGTGFELLAQIRQKPNLHNLPVIFLTSKANPSDKVLAFSVGADDYIVKPFEPLELRARVDAKLKRMSEPQIIRGQFRLNLGTQQAFIQNQSQETEAQLTPNEFKLLAYFLINEGQILSREKILTSVWGQSLNVTDRTIDTHVYALRKKLGDSASCISSVFGEGYRFKASP